MTVPSPGSYRMVYYSVLLNCFLDCFRCVHATRIVVFISFLIMGNNKCTALLSSSFCSMF